jgi:hypothetical protein
LSPSGGGAGGGSISSIIAILSIPIRYKTCLSNIAIDNPYTFYNFYNFS